jgi:ornithine cyclodeaminase/alanine dehydrogenase-like protein (mu-crystallin family)
LNLPFYSEDDVKEALSMTEAISAMRKAFTSLSNQIAIVPNRINLPIKDQNALHLSMPAYIKGGKYIMIKLVNVHFDNPNNNLPLINGLILMMDAKIGTPIALIDGKSVTSLRTGASSGLATELLSKSDSKIGVVVGTGAQAVSQVEAIQCVRNLKSIKVIGRTIDKAEEFCNQFDSFVEPGNNDCLVDADIICTATTSDNPLFEVDDIKPGVHINAVGAHQSKSRELASNLIQKGKVYIDQLEPSKHEAGDILIPITEGIYSWDNIEGELGELIDGKIEGRKNDLDITIFNSIGNAIQDLVIGTIILEKNKN